MPQRPNVRSTAWASSSFKADMETVPLNLLPLSLMAAALAYSGLMIIAMRR